MRVNPKFTRRFETEINNAVRAAYEDLNGLSACAGIDDDSGVGAMEAARQHYGYTVEMRDKLMFIRPRDFVSFATHDNDYEQEIKKIIKDRIQAAKITKSQRIKYTTSAGTTINRIAAGNTTPFFIGERKKNSPTLIMTKIAEQMARNQYDAITSWRVTPPNSMYWRKKKGMDLPPLEGIKGEIVNNIKGWVE